MKDTKKHGHPGNQFNRKAPPGEEGYNFGVSITSAERALLKRELLRRNIEPTQKEISGLARNLMKQAIANLEKEQRS